MSGAVRNLGLLYWEARGALGFSSQRQLAEALGFSERTGQRWATGQSTPSALTTGKLARLVYPRNRALAEELAQRAGQTLVGLGLEKPAPLLDPAAAQPPSPPPQLPPKELLVDSVVCVAASTAKLPPDDVRASLLAAFRRTRALGMTVDDVVQALSGKK